MPIKEHIDAASAQDSESRKAYLDSICISVPSCQSACRKACRCHLCSRPTYRKNQSRATCRIETNPENPVPPNLSEDNALLNPQSSLKNTSAMLRNPLESKNPEVLTVRQNTYLFTLSSSLFSRMVRISRPKECIPCESLVSLNPQIALSSGYPLYQHPVSTFCINILYQYSLIALSSGFL
jgi:hypothetical protein